MDRRLGHWIGDRNIGASGHRGIGTSGHRDIGASGHRDIGASGASGHRGIRGIGGKLQHPRPREVAIPATTFEKRPELALFSGSSRAPEVHMLNKRELHEQLFRRAELFSKAVEKFTRPLLNAIASRETAQQLRDSSSSVASNYKAAGDGRSHDEFTAELGTVQEEIDESVYEAHQLARIFGKSYSTARRTQHERQERRRRESRKRRRPDDPIR